MPRRALRCVVDLQLNLVSAPGVWLPCKEDVYLSVSLFGQYRNTRLITSMFPLLVHEKFRFEKTYYTAVDPGYVADLLADELVIFELVQLSEYCDGAVRLASFSQNVRDFLYPYPTLAPSYSAHEREVLMCRTVAFPGISPKLEFTTTTVVKESYSPELDALDDALEYEKDARSRSRSRSRAVVRRSRWREKSPADHDQSTIQMRVTNHMCPPHYCLPTVSSLCRSRSLSPSRKLADITLDDTPRPPFVVRKLDDDLIGRKPGHVTDKGAESKPKRSSSPYRSPVRTDRWAYVRERKRPRSSRPVYTRPLTALPSYRLTEVIRNPYLDPLPVFKSKFDDLDSEVASLTSVSPTLKSPRPRSVSPLRYRSSFLTRYGDYVPRAYSPYYYDYLLDKELDLARSRRISRAYSDYYKSIDDLDLDLRLARIRAGLYY